MQSTLFVLFLAAASTVFYAAGQGQGPPCNPGNPNFNCTDSCDCAELRYCPPAFPCFRLPSGNETEPSCDCNQLTPCDSSHPCWRTTVVNGTLTDNNCDCDSIACSTSHPCYHRQCSCD
nr:CP20k-like protein 6 [Amphibalanus amphitrite]